MEQDPACTRSLRSLTAASSPARGEEQGAAGEARSLELLGFVPLGSSAGVPREPEPLRMVWQSCQLIFFTIFLKGGGRMSVTRVGTLEGTVAK